MDILHSEDVEIKTSLVEELSPQTAAVYKEMTEQGTAPDELLKAFACSLSDVLITPGNQKQVLATVKAMEIVSSTIVERKGRKVFFNDVAEANEKLLEIYDLKNPRIQRKYTPMG